MIVLNSELSKNIFQENCIIQEKVDQQPGKNGLSDSLQDLCHSNLILNNLRKLFDWNTLLRH